MLRNEALAECAMSEMLQNEALVALAELEMLVSKALLAFVRPQNARKEGGLMGVWGRGGGFAMVKKGLKLAKNGQ